MWTVKVLGLLAAVQVLLSALLSGILGADAVAALFTQAIRIVAVGAIVMGLVGGETRSVSGSRWAAPRDPSRHGS